jgi:phosphoglycolate phosphatase-like HAD superfamily hydrolase
MFDTTRANKAYYNQILNNFDRPPMNTEQFNFVHMHTVDESVAYLFGDPETIDAAHRYRKGMAYTPFFKYMRIESGLPSLLNKLQAEHKTAVATNRSDTIKPLLKKFKLENYFDLVVSSLDVKRPKPFPDQLIKILDYFEIDPVQAVYIGDSEVDGLASQAAGVPFIAYRNPSLNAKIHIRRFSQLHEMLGI